MVPATARNPSVHPGHSEPADHVGGQAGVGLTKAARGDDTVIREQFNLVVEQDDTPLHSRLQPCPG